MTMVYLPSKRSGQKIQRKIIDENIDSSDLKSRFEKLKEISEGYQNGLRTSYFDYRLEGINYQTENIETLIDDVSLYHGKRFGDVDNLLKRLGNSLRLKSEYDLKIIKNIERQQEVLADSLGLIAEEAREIIKAKKEIHIYDRTEDEFFKDTDDAIKQAGVLEEEKLKLENERLLERDKFVYIFDEILNRLEILIP